MSEELERENKELKQIITILIQHGVFWVKSGADDSKEVRIGVTVGTLRDAVLLLEE